MYATKQFVELPDNILLPSCMYKTNPFYSLKENYSNNAELCENKALRRNTGNSPATSFTELENRQYNVLQKLNDFKNKLDALMGNKITLQIKPENDLNEIDATQRLCVHDIVVGANVNNPPYSLLLLKKMLKDCCLSVHSCCSVHSSITKVNERLLSLFEDQHATKASSAISFTIQWKDQPFTSLMVNPLYQSMIVGEANVIRYISRLFPAVSSLNYESRGSFSVVSETDFWMDALQSHLLEGSGKDKQAFLKRLNSRLGRVPWIDGEDYSVSDIFAWSILLQLNMHGSLPSNVDSWFKKISNFIQIPEILTKDTCNDMPEGDAKEQPFINRAGLESLLQNLGIKYQVRDHPEAFTVAELLTHVSDMPGLHMKNLFLKDKKKNLYLLCARHDAEVNLSEIGKGIGAKDLRFGVESTMYDTLGVKQGCVTLFSLLNDSNHQVRLLLDAEALNKKHTFVNFHPMTNSATLGINPSDLKVFLDKSGHKPTLINM